MEVCEVREMIGKSRIFMTGGHNEGNILQRIRYNKMVVVMMMMVVIMMVLVVMMMMQLQNNDIL